MKTAIGIGVVSVLVIGFTVSAPASNRLTLSVMTQNQFLGGDIQSVASAPDLPSFLAAARATLTEIAANNFPERAGAFAREIAERRPHIVGLQEVYDFKLNGQHGEPPFVDHLTETLDAIEALGEAYVVVASVRNLDLTIPVDLEGDGVFEFVSLTDRDVILARADLVAAGAVTPVALSEVCPRPSADFGPGCNFVTVAEAHTPFGVVLIERGYVAVDVAWGGLAHRVVNTHLEVENLDPSNPLSPIIQSIQATELKEVLDSLPFAGTVILMGDLNSTPEDPLFPHPTQGPFVRPYQQLAGGVSYTGAPTTGGPFVDTWLLRPGSPPGFTCCISGLLSNPDGRLTERKDLVFTRGLTAPVKANTVGNDPDDRTPSGLWPSDHAGVVVRFGF